jgi:hypothetical protein
MAYVSEDDYEYIAKYINKEYIESSTHIYIVIRGWNCDGRTCTEKNKIRIKNKQVHMKDLRQINIFNFYEGLNGMEFTFYKKKKILKQVYISL